MSCKSTKYNIEKSSVFERIFTKIAKLGCGLEINYGDMWFSEEETDIILRPFKIAKKCGCNSREL